MAVTILESSKLYAGDPLKQGVIETFAQNSDILQYLPFENVNGSGVRFTREDVLPGIGFRAVNTAYSEDAGTLDELNESLRILGGDLDVDKFIVETQGARQRSLRTAMKVKALAHKFTATVVKGDASTTPTEFDGLQKRLGDTAGRQVIHAGTTSGGDALSLLRLDDLCGAVDSPTHLIMNKTMRNRLSAAARSASVGGYVTWDKDNFGTPIMLYGGLKILIADEDNAGSQILPFTEPNPGGGTAASTSIYCVSLKEGMLTGIQSRDIDVRDLGEQDSKEVYRTRLNWYVSFAIWSARGAARLRGITNSAITA